MDFITSILRKNLARRRSSRVLAAKACGIASVTPWLWLGGGERRVVSAAAPHGGTKDDFTWDYDEPYSWMIGREIADPFYSSARFAPCQAARSVALFPNTFSTDSWTSLPQYRHIPGGPLISCGADCVAEHLRTSVTLKHFVSYVLGAANIPRTNQSASAFPASNRGAMKMDDAVRQSPASSGRYNVRNYVAKGDGLSDER